MQRTGQENVVAHQAAVPREAAALGFQDVGEPFAVFVNDALSPLAPALGTGARQAAAVESQQLGLAELRPYEVGPSDVLNVALTGLSLASSSGAGGTAAGPLNVRVNGDGSIALPMVVTSKWSV